MKFNPEDLIRLEPRDYLGQLAEHERKYAPAFLYALGDKELLQRGPRVAVVGSRKASPDGRKRAAAFVRKLVEREMVVVSGLAEGIDTVAHSTAIELGGATIAVLGTPLDKTYPKQNADLQQTIADQYLVISQFAIGQAITPKNFVIRNRTMALLSDATVIVEAGEKSGTEHQAWEALRLGRHVYIFEEVLSAGIKWARKVMDYGALAITLDSADDALDELPEFTSLATTLGAFAL